MSREICILQQDTPEQGGLQVNVTSTIGIQPIAGAAVKIFSGQTQVEELLKDGCTYAQGYFYDRPMPVREFEREYLIRGEKGDGWQ